MKRRSLLVSLCLMIIIMSTLSPSTAMAFGEGCAVYRTTAYSVLNTTWTPIPFDAERRDDSLQCHVSDGTTMIVAEGYAGWYVISGNVVWATVPATSYLAVYLNGATYIAMQVWLVSSGQQESISTLYYLNEGDTVQLVVYQSSGASRNLSAAPNYGPEFRMVRLGPGSHPAFNSIQNLPGVASTPQAPQAHAARHQDGGVDEINVNGLSGILTDTQDAGWLQSLSITTTIPDDGYALTWNAAESEWQPATISGTGSYTMPDIITATISGTVPVIITSTYQFTEMLSSGHDLAIIRSFTYGEVSIAIGLFVIAAMTGIKLLFALQRR